jgi:hypothetical protein
MGALYHRVVYGQLDTIQAILSQTDVGQVVNTVPH